MNATAEPESTGIERFATVEGYRPSAIPFQQGTLQTKTGVAPWNCFEVLPPFELTDGDASIPIEYKNWQALKGHVLALNPNIIITDTQFVYPITLEFPTNEVLEVYSVTKLKPLFEECQSELSN